MNTVLTNLLIPPLTEDLSDGEEVFPKEIAKWNSNDLMDKIEAAETEETPGMMNTSTWAGTAQWHLMLNVCLCF